jgi:hypothetical protein
MADEAEILRECLEKLAILMEVAELLPLEQRDHIAKTIQIGQAAIEAVTQAQLASEEARRLVEEAKETAQRLSKPN